MTPGGHDSASKSYGAAIIDGLALGETTPGPLIMVVTFIGFVGGRKVSAALSNGCRP